MLLHPAQELTYTTGTKVFGLKDAPRKSDRKYYKKFVDDITVLFKKYEHFQQFATYVNKQHSNIRFSMEAEKNGALPFLDIKIYWEKGKFVSSVNRKEIFTGFNLLKYLFGLSYTLFHRCFCLVSDFSKIHMEVESLKKFSQKMPTHRNM